MSAAPTTNYIDSSGNGQTPNSLSLPQDLSAIFIPNSGSTYNFTNSYSGLRDATGYKYYNGSSYVDISNIFDISTNPSSYTAGPFLLGYKIRYGPAGTPTDIGQIFGLIKPVPPPSWSGFYLSTSSYPSGSTFQYNSIAMSSDGKYLTAVTDDGYVWTSNTYGYDPSGVSTKAWTKGSQLVTNRGSSYYIWSGCAMSLSGQYQAAFFSNFLKVRNPVYSSNFGVSQIFYSTNYGSSWSPLNADFVGGSSSSLQFGNGNVDSSGCSFFNMVLSNDGDTLSICSNVTITNTNPQDTPFSVTYTYTNLISGNNGYRFNKNTGSESAPNGPNPGTNGVPTNGCGVGTSSMRYSLAMNASGKRIFGILQGGPNDHYLTLYTNYAVTDTSGNTIFKDSINTSSLPAGKGPLYILATRNPTQSDVTTNGTQVIIGYTYDVGLYYTEYFIDNTKYPPTATFNSSGTLHNNYTNSSAMTVDFDKNQNKGYIFSVKTQDRSMYRYNANGGSTVQIGSSSFNYDFCDNLTDPGEFGTRCPNNAVCCSNDGTYVAAITTGGIYVCSTGKTVT
jgi:hypothetical protein